jgi:hypothetical protein
MRIHADLADHADRLQERQARRAQKKLGFEMIRMLSEIRVNPHEPSTVTAALLLGGRLRRRTRR